MLSDCLKHKGYFQHVKLFETNLPIDQFPQVVSLVPPFSSVSTCSQLTLSLHREWGIQSMSSLRRLTSLLFSSLACLMSHVTVNVTQHEILVSYGLPKSSVSIGLPSFDMSAILGLNCIVLNNQAVLKVQNGITFSFQKAFVMLVTLPSSIVLKLVKFFVKLRIDINVRINDGTTILLAASSQGYSDVVTFLLSEGADPNIATVEGFTPIIIACVKGYFDTVKALVHNSPNDVINTFYTSNSIFPLQCASVYGHTRVVEYLLQNGADPNVCSADGATALILSCIHCHVDIAKLLLDACRGRSQCCLSSWE